jgi:hypothetical protein
MAKPMKYHIIAALGIVGAVAVIVLAITIMAGGSGRSLNRGEEMSRESRSFVEESFEIGDIQSISVSGVWKVSIRPGSGLIELDAPREIIEYVKDNSGRTLNLGVPGGFRGFRGTPEAVVYLESLERISLEGAARIEMEDLDLDELIIDAEGAGSLEAENVTVNDLILNLEGASKIDFMDSSVVNARVDVEGAAEVDLMMGGGSLKGSLEGIGRIRYRGDVTEREFSIDGLGSINYLD